MTESEWMKRLKEQTDLETFLAFADWLEEQGRPVAAAHQRARAGVSRIVYAAVALDSDEVISGEYGRLVDLKNHMIVMEKYRLGTNHPVTPPNYRVMVREVRTYDVGIVTQESLRTRLKG